MNATAATRFSAALPFWDNPWLLSDLLTGPDPAARSGILASAADIGGERQFAATKGKAAASRRWL